MIVGYCAVSTCGPYVEVVGVGAIRARPGHGRDVGPALGVLACSSGSPAPRQRDARLRSERERRVPGTRRRPGSVLAEDAWRGLPGFRFECSLRAWIFRLAWHAAVAAAWRRAGLRPVVLSAADIIPALQTGMMDCLNNVPLYALTTRTFTRTRYLIDLPWGFMVGATVVRRDAWERIPEALRPRLLEAAREVGVKIDEEVRHLNAAAIEAMRGQGLELVGVDAEAWRPAMERSWEALRGPVVPAPFFDEVVAARDACRAGAPAATAGRRE